MKDNNTISSLVHECFIMLCLWLPNQYRLMQIIFWVRQVRKKLCVRVCMCMCVRVSLCVEVRVRWRACMPVEQHKCCYRERPKGSLRFQQSLVPLSPTFLPGCNVYAPYASMTHFSIKKTISGWTHLQDLCAEKGLHSLHDNNRQVSFLYSAIHL